MAMTAVHPGIDHDDASYRTPRGLAGRAEDRLRPTCRREIGDRRLCLSTRRSEPLADPPSVSMKARRGASRSRQAVTRRVGGDTVPAIEHAPVERGDDVRPTGSSTAFAEHEPTAG
jgi:hypothetical protein